jgi:hypothetical protein
LVSEGGVAAESPEVAGAPDVAGGLTAPDGIELVSPGVAELFVPFALAGGMAVSLLVGAGAAFAPAMSVEALAEVFVAVPVLAAMAMDWRSLGEALR